jgi:hypothetical protein
MVGRERRTQVVQHQLLELESALQPEVRLGEEIGVAIELQRTLVEHAGVEMELGGILVLSRENVANVLGDAVDVRHDQGPRVVRLDVGTGTLSNPYLVHLQGVNRSERILPPTLLDGHAVRVLQFCLTLFEVDARAIDAKIRHQLAEDQVRPLDARRELRDVDDRRVRRRVLNDHQILQIETEADDVEVDAPQARRVALEAAVEPVLHETAQRAIHQDPGRRQQQEDHAGRKDDAPQPPVPGMEPAAARLQPAGPRVPAWFRSPLRDAHFAPSARTHRKSGIAAEKRNGNSCFAAFMTRRTRCALVGEAGALAARRAAE